MKKIIYMEKIIRLLAYIFIIISLLLFMYFIYKYMDAHNLTPGEQSNLKNNIIDPIGPHVDKRIHEAQTISLYAFNGTLLAAFFYGISRILKSKI